MANSTLIVSPKMRLLQGDAFTPSTTDMQGNPMTVKTGPNAGQPTQSFVITCGIAKNDPEAIPYLLKLAAIAAAAKPKLWPQGVITPPAAFHPASVADIAKMFGCTHPQYALKIQDGDGLDGNGNSNATKEGCAGHWIVKMSQPSAPKVYEVGKYSDMERVDIDKAKHSLLKRGYYIRVGAQVSDNENEQRPGLYLNPGMIEIMHAGPEITSGPDAASVFGGAAAPTPSAPTPPTPPVPAAAGLTMTGAYDYATLKAAGWSDQQMIDAGHAVAPVVAPPVPPSPATPPAPPAAPTPPASPPAPPVATPSPSSPPYDGFMKTPEQRMLPGANGIAFAAYIDNGWTEEMLVSKGMMSAA